MDARALMASSIFMVTTIGMFPCMLTPYVLSHAANAESDISVRN